VPRIGKSWYILCPFGIFYGYLWYSMYDHSLHFVFIWYSFSRFGIMHQEKSGNPDGYLCQMTTCNWEICQEENMKARVTKKWSTPILLTNCGSNICTFMAGKCYTYIVSVILRLKRVHLVLSIFSVITSTPGKNLSKKLKSWRRISVRFGNKSFFFL
jgi:hypothetical protein